MFNNNVNPGGGKNPTFSMSNFVYPNPICCVKNCIPPLKWYTPPKVKTKHLIMYFYGVLSCFGIWDFVHFSAGKRDFNANLGGKQDYICLTHGS